MTHVPPYGLHPCRAGARLCSPEAALPVPLSNRGIEKEYAMASISNSRIGTCESDAPTTSTFSSRGAPEGTPNWVANASHTVARIRGAHDEQEEEQLEYGGP